MHPCCRSSWSSSGLLAIFNSVAGAIWSYLIKEYPSAFSQEQLRHRWA